MSLWLFSFLASPLLYKLYRSARQNTTTTTTATTHQEAQNNHDNEQKNEMNHTTIDHDHQQKTEHELTLKSSVVEEQPHGSISMNNHHHMNDELDHTVEIELPQSVISNNNNKNNNYNHSYEASAGIIWMHGQNAPISYDTPGGELPYLYEQCNVISTLIKNRNQL